MLRDTYLVNRGMKRRKHNVTPGKLAGNVQPLLAHIVILKEQGGFEAKETNKQGERLGTFLLSTYL